MLEHGKPLIFGEKRSKGIKMDGYRPVVVDLNDGVSSVNDLIVHDETDSMLASILSNMSFEEHLPRPMGVIQAIENPSFDYKVEYQINHEIETKGPGNIQNLLYGDESWEIK